MILTLVMVFSLITPVSANTGGFNLRLQWNTKGKDPVNFVNNSSADETTLVTLKVLYDNKEVGTGYAPGELIITVDGLGGAKRNGITQADAVAADKPTDTTKKYDWTYTYSSATDTYTFTNNAAIAPNSVFEGSFELIWEFPTRTTINNYQKTLSAKLRTAKYEEVSSGNVTYSQTRGGDNFEVAINTSRIYSSDGLEGPLPGGKTGDDYAWVNYTFTASHLYRARDVNGYLVFDVWFPAGAIVQGQGFTKTSQTRTEGTQVYEMWTTTKDIRGYSRTSPIILQDVFVAYEKAVYDKKSVKITAELSGVLLDDVASTDFGTRSLTIDLTQYDYIKGSGIFARWKRAYGVYNKFTEAHCAQCKEYGAINSAHIVTGKREYDTNMYFWYDYSPNAWDYIDAELVDDFIDVEMTNGQFRKLEDDEYTFTKIYIPTITSIRNINGLPLKATSFDVDIYVRYRNGSYTNMTFLQSTTMDATAKTITLPDDVVGIRVAVRNIQESIGNLYVKSYYKFHTTATDINTSGGRLINNMFLQAYGEKNGTRTWLNPMGRSGYTDDREYQRDMNTYGSGLDRELATLHILDIPNQYAVTNNISLIEETATQYRFEGSFNTDFKIEEGNTLNQFSVYTIVPDGLNILDRYNDPEDLLDYLTITGQGLNSGYLKDHVEIEIIEDYKGSGRQYIGFHFDFGDEGVTASYINISKLPMYVEKDSVLDLGSISYTMHVEVLIDQLEGKWYANSNDNNSIENGLWRDIDNDGNRTEVVAYNKSSVTKLIPAFSQLEITKAIRTGLTDGYVQPIRDNDTGDYLPGEEIPETYGSQIYTYRLRTRTGNAPVKDITFFDAIETTGKHEWQGEFVSIDYAVAQRILGVAPTIYYSSQVETFDLTTDLTSGNWTTNRPQTVRSVAVSFKNAIAPIGTIIYVDMRMRAPRDDDGSLLNKMTENNYIARYDILDEKLTFVETSSLESNFVPVVLIPHQGTIRLTKRDATNGKTLEGVKFDLYRMEGATPADTDEIAEANLVTNASGAIRIKVPYGYYYFKEKEAAKGYELITEPIHVVLDDPEPEITVNVEVENERKKGEITFSKISDRRSGNRPVEGAKFSLYTSESELIKENIVSGVDGTFLINNLPWGDYYLIETEAPDGYELSDKKVFFTIEADNDAGRLENVKITNKQIPAYAELIKYERLEDDTVIDTVYIDGAVYELFDADDNNKSLGRYITDENGKIYVDDLSFGSYYFVEAVAAKGYERYEEQIPFVIDAEHTHASLKVETNDKRLRGRVRLLKLDDTGANVKDAVFGLFDANTNKRVGPDGQEATAIDYRTSAEGQLAIDEIYWGDYYIQEITAPLGYELDDQKHPVIVNRDTVNNIIIIETTNIREKGKIELTKVDEADENVTLSGAVFTLYRENGTVYRDDLVTDADGILLVEDIDWGSYYFLEKTAPAGYGLNTSKIRFSVNNLTAGKKQELMVTDPQETYELKITKRINVADIVIAHGNPTFTFKIEGQETVSGKLHKYYKNVTFDKAYIEAHLDDEYIEQSIVVGVPFGRYSISEEETVRYELDNNGVSIVSGPAIQSVTDGVATIEFKNTDTVTSASILFKNVKTHQKSTSDTGLVVNIIGSERKLTSIVAIWNGPKDPVGTIDRNLLDVYAVYDDGTQEKLDNADYSLSQDVMPAGMHGDIAIEVTYVETGVTRKDSFILSYDGQAFFTWDVIDSDPYTDPDTGITYDGQVRVKGYYGDSDYIVFPAKVTGLRPDETTFTNDGNTYKVTSVGTEVVEQAIHTKVAPSQIRLPEGLLEVGTYAFYNKTTLVGNLVIPDSVETIADFAFQGCTGYTGTLTLQSGVGKSRLKYIGEGAFVSSDLNMAAYAGGWIESWGGLNFTGALVIPDSVETIGDESFSYSSGFTSVTFESSSGASNLKYIGYAAFFWSPNMRGDLVIPDSVEYIGDLAFFMISYSLYNSGDEVSLILESSSGTSNLKYIGSHAFFDISYFKSNLIIPDSVETIGPYAFYRSVYTGLTLESDTGRSNIKTIGEHAFSGGKYGGALIIPDSVEYIGTNAFQGCNGFTSLTLESGVGASNLKTIETYAFYGCSGFTGSLVIPDSVESIGNSAFQGCVGFDGTLTLESAVGASNLKTIGAWAFVSSQLSSAPGSGAFYPGLNFTESLIIPDSVESIGEGAFCYSRKFTGELVLESSPGASNLKTIGDKAFFWGVDFTGDLVIPDSVESIGERAFYSCNRFTSLTLESSVGASSLKTIGEQAFAIGGFDGSLAIPDSVETIGNGAFASCSGFDGTLTLESAVGTSSLKTIGSGVFQGCVGFTGTVTIPANVTSIGSSSFNNMTAITQVRIPNKFLSDPNAPYGLGAGKYVFY